MIVPPTLTTSNYEDINYVEMHVFNTPLVGQFVPIYIYIYMHRMKWILLKRMTTFDWPSNGN